MIKIITIAFFTLYTVTTIASSDNRLGAQTYQVSCHSCHAPNVAQGIKSPAAFDVKAWNKRFRYAAQKSQKDPKRFLTPVDFLLYQVKSGKALMPHGGLCHEANVANKNCSDAALKSAILYMRQPHP